MQTYPAIRQDRLVEAFSSLASLKNQNLPPILSNLVSRRLEEIEQLACLYEQVLPQSLQGEVISESRFELNLEILVQKSTRFIVVCVGLFQAFWPNFRNAGEYGYFV